MAREARGKASTLPKTSMESGPWGVAQGCNCQHILSATASLIRAQRSDMALIILEKEIELFLV